MNRCLHPRRRHIAACLALALGTLATLPAPAQTDGAAAAPMARQFPKGVLRGEMVVNQPPQITMDGKAEQLTPGARIRDTNNHLVMSGQIVGKPVVVNYLREAVVGGGVHQVWILTPEEARQRLPGMKRSWFDVLSGEPADAPATTSP